MAVAVISGLIVSTLLSLVFVPTVFLLMDSFSGVLHRLFGRFIGERDEPPQTVDQRPGMTPPLLDGSIA